MSKSEIRDVFENFDVVTFLEQHNVKYDEWLKSQIFQLVRAIEKDVLKVLEGCVCVPQQELGKITEIVEARISVANEYGEVAVRDGVTEKVFLQTVLRRLQERIWRT